MKSKIDEIKLFLSMNYELGKDISNSSNSHSFELAILFPAGIYLDF